MRLFDKLHLTLLNDELVVGWGENPNSGRHTEKRVLVIGGGVTGLTVSSQLKKHSLNKHHFQSAWALLDAGYSVTIVSDRWASQDEPITSQIAGALCV